jgi:decaprenylphospho-beta-D-erythro-pentofuranosid-2-ulose 2-reductase
VNDAIGMPQSALLLGGTSDIGLALLEQLAHRRLERVVLAGRDEETLAEAKQRVEKAGVGEVAIAKCDLAKATDIASLPRRTEEAIGALDMLIVAAGELGTAELSELSPRRVMSMFAANAAGPSAAMIAIAQVMAKQGYGRIVVLSSVAGLRVRKANFVYGAGKAALDGLALGLADALEGTGVTVTVIRPGFVRTKMTAGLPDAPLSTDAATVAAATVRALEKDQRVAYVPPLLGPLFAVLRVIPRSLFRRLPG